MPQLPPRAIAGPISGVIPKANQGLAAAVAWSLPTAVLAGICLPAAAAIAAIGALLAIGSRRPHRRAGLCALPILLATTPPRPPEAIEPSAGPAWVEGRVREVVRAPLIGRNYVEMVGGLRIVFPGTLELLPGDSVRALVRCRPTTIPGLRPSMQALPATMSVTPGAWSIRRFCARLRRALERELLRIVPGDHGATLATLVLGRATRPSADLAEAHRATGLSHLLAVSGAHAAMLALLLGMASRGRRLGASRARATSVLLILMLYGCIAGGEPPVLRAVIAYTLAAIAARIGRPFGIAQGLLIPAWVTCLVAPEALLGPSFLLSYAAVIGLGMAVRERPPESPAEWLYDGLRASLYATLLTAPLTLGFFSQLAPWTIALTPICAPLVALMLLLGLVAATISLVAPSLGDLFSLPLEAITSSYTWIVHTADWLPGTPIPAWYHPPPWAIAAATATAIAVLAWSPKKRNLILSICAISSLWFVSRSPALLPQLRLFAIGHGQAALLITPDARQVVVDCGSLQGGARAARRLEESLTRRTIDLLVITHADQDHFNGVPFLAAKLHIERALLPLDLARTPLHDLLLDCGCSVEVLKPGASTTVLAGLQAFAPDLPKAARDNDRSIWLHADLGETGILFSGDAQEAGIAAALASDFARPADVLVLPHHGRKNANAPHLLARVKPRSCLASATTVDGQTPLGSLCHRFGADLWVTGQHGHLTVRPAGKGRPAQVSSTPPQPRLR